MGSNLTVKKLSRRALSNAISEVVEWNNWRTRDKAVVQIKVTKIKQTCHGT